MANQSVVPNEIIIIDSSKKPINKDIFEKIFNSKKYKHNL